MDESGRGEGNDNNEKEKKGRKENNKVFQVFGGGVESLCWEECIDFDMKWQTCCTEMCVLFMTFE